MKKVLLISIVALLSIMTVSAQDATAILENYVKKTGVAAFNETKDGRSSMLDMEMTIMGMSIPIKVITKYPDFARIEMETQGVQVLIILRDTVAYVSAQGQTQTITDKAQFEQYAQMRDMVGQMAPSMSDLLDIKYIGKEGKGKNEWDVIEATSKKDKSVSKMYFNTETGLLDKSLSEVEVGGKKNKVSSSFKKYTSFDDGALLLPTVMSIKSAQANIEFKIKAFETDFPVATWMFAAPKK